MKLSSRARYAIRAMMVVAKKSNGGNPVNLGVVAHHTAISRRYLEQVAITLKSAGLLRAVSGKKGGHLLARPAAKIRLGEIVEAMIGSINIVRCAVEPKNCPRSGSCDSRHLYTLVNRQVRDTFNRFSLADLVAGRVKRAVARELGSG